MTAAATLLVQRPSVPATGDTPPGPVSPMPGGADLPALNVVEWDQVHSLPWQEASPAPARPTPTPRLRRRRVEPASLAEVVERIARAAR